MNTEQIKCLIESVLSRRSVSASDRYNLCIVDGKLKVLTSNSKIIFDENIAVLSELQIVTGFTAGQWNSYAGRIAEYCERAKKCLADLTP